jgi:hypothetical protein
VDVTGGVVPASEELMTQEVGDGREAADSLLRKIRTFVAEELDDEEAALFAALVAPGVARAYQTADEVDWHPRALPDSLARAVRDGGIRVEGLGGR